MTENQPPITPKKQDELKEFLKQTFEQITLEYNCPECCGAGTVEIYAGGGNTKTEKCKNCGGTGRLQVEYYDAKIKDFGKWVKAKLPGNRDVYVSEMPEIK